MARHESLGEAFRITVAADPEKTPALLATAVAWGALQVWTGRARGVLHPKRFGPLTLPALSPTFDLMNLVVTKSRLEGMMDALVDAGQLFRFGAGAIHATRLTRLVTRGRGVCAPVPRTRARGPSHDYQRGLVEVSCICQSGHGDEIARRAMKAGSPSPMIRFGYGHGIRDRLGFFLQQTINPRKEWIDVVVGSAEADRIFETMVDAGHLDQPAQGFIHTAPVHLGLINTMSYENTTPYPATMEQVIKAIDKMQGNTHWRSTGSVQTLARPQRKRLSGLVNVTAVVKRGLGDDFSLAAMEAGASGTTAAFVNAYPLVEKMTHLEHTDEREILSFTVPERHGDRVVDEVLRRTETGEGPLALWTHPAPEALTYLP